MNNKNPTKSFCSLFTKITLIIFLIIFESCQGQVYDENIVDLKSFNLKTNISKFYAKSLNRENIKITNENQYIVKDTITEYDIDWNGNRDEIFGTHYRVISYSESDTVAKYSNVNFFLVESMVNEQNELMILNAKTESNSNKINKLISDLNIEFNKKPEINQNDSGFFYYRILTWRNESKLVKLVTDVKLDFSNIEIDEDSKEAITKIDKNDLNNSILYICKPKFEQKLLGKVGIGNWSRFK